MHPRTAKELYLSAPKGAPQLAVCVSAEKRLAIARTFPIPRRLDILWWEEEMEKLEARVTNGNLFASPSPEAGSEDLEKVKVEYREKVQSFRLALISESMVEGLERPFKRDIRTMAWLRGKVFDKAQGRRYGAAKDLANLSGPCDHATVIVSDIVGKVASYIEFYFIGPVSNLVSGREERVGPDFEYGIWLDWLSRVIVSLMVSGAIAVPILALTLITSMERKIITVMVATCLLPLFFSLLLNPTTPELIFISASVIALMVIFISNDPMMITVGGTLRTQNSTVFS